MIFKDDGLAPLVEVTPVAQTVKLGEPININCSAMGSRPLVLQWSHGSRMSALPPGAEQSNGVLTIPSVRAQDGGDYFCAASNEHGLVFEQAFVFVDSGKFQVLPKFVGFNSKRFKNRLLSTSSKS